MDKVIVVSIDGLGIGAMPDSNSKANTWKSLLDNSSDKDFLFLKSIMNNAKKISLDYKGADSYLGHLTMSGVPTHILSLKPLLSYKDKIIDFIKKQKLSYEIFKGMIVVEEELIIYDNFEADHGLAINIAGLKDKISFSKQVKFSEGIRKIIENPRLITFSANNISMEDLKSFTVSDNGYNGILTPKTGIYNSTFEVKHFPANVDFKKSIQYILAEKGIKVNLYGKFENIINIEHANIHKDKNIDIDYIFRKVLENKEQKSIDFINIQQTDLAGHSGDVAEYIRVLNIMDKYLKEIYNSNEKMIIISDHGNDPEIKDGKHNREYVPLATNFRQKKPITTLSQLPQLITSLFS